MHDLHKLLLFHVLTCLGRNVDGSEIINGNEAPEKSMLYMVSLQSYGIHVCGGFLVTEDFVLTAAHCNVFAPTRVVLGTHTLARLGDGKTRFIKEKHIHPDYVCEGGGNDIMLLKLTRKVELDNKIQTIPLPSFGTNIKDKKVCSVAGWGSISTGGNVVDQLRVVNVSVISPQMCRTKWRNLPDNVICAEGYEENQGFCQGDSGGPLVCDGIAVGVVSFNNNKTCDYPDLPNVYSEISKYTKWILEKLTHE